MKKSIAAILLAAASTSVAATPATAAHAFKILCQEPGTGGTQRMEAYESAPGVMEVWYNLHAHIKVFEPLIRGTPIGPDDVIHAQIPALGMDLRYHTTHNLGYATMKANDFARVFNGIPGRPVTTINGWRCAADVMRTKPRIMPFDPHPRMP